MEKTESAVNFNEVEKSSKLKITLAINRFQLEILFDKIQTTLKIKGNIL